MPRRTQVNLTLDAEVVSAYKEFAGITNLSLSRLVENVLTDLLKGKNDSISEVRQHFNPPKRRKKGR